MLWIFTLNIEAITICTLRNVRNSCHVDMEIYDITEKKTVSSLWDNDNLNGYCYTECSGLESIPGNINEKMRYVIQKFKGIITLCEIVFVGFLRKLRL